MANTETETVYDVIVLGSGAAGLNLVLNLPPNLTAAVFSKGPLHEGATYYAQGGIAAVLDETDSIDNHVRDTMIAGAGLCDEPAVRYIVENAPKAIRRLAEMGVDFTLEEMGGGLTAYHLTREGGHSHRRVVHAADATGKAVEKTLVARAGEATNLHVFENHMAIDLIKDGDRCIGVYALDHGDGHVKAFRARAVVLATGGAARAYLYSSNPDGSTGDGIAMAWRAGCRVADLEFTQFHPTCLYQPEAKSFLISEAVRGEGGLLKLPSGERFMDGFDERGELAPRDVVARAIDHEMKRLGVEHVYLDISHKPADFIEEHFPTIYARCLKYGFDMTREPLPVVPAAHYTCGGVITDLKGRTDVAGLYAIGETAWTGLHGANRMASNSLLECLVMSAAAAQDISQSLDDIGPPPAVAPWDESWVTDSDEEVVVSHNWDELRRFMWDYVGIVRTDKRLERAQHRVDLLQSEIADYYGNFRVTSDLLELRNLATVANLIVRAAQSRKESRGLHYTLDYPDLAPKAVHTVLTP